MSTLSGRTFLGVSNFFFQSEAARDVREQRKQTKRQKPFKHSQFTSKNKEHHQELLALASGQHSS
jgi:hypothetical protein